MTRFSLVEEFKFDIYIYLTNLKLRLLVDYMITRTKALVHLIAPKSSAQTVKFPIWYHQKYDLFI
jgi:hypothetical protein